MTDQPQVLGRIKSALEPFAKSAERDWDDDAPDDMEIWSSQGPGWSVSKDSYTVGDLRAAREALALIDGLGEVDEGALATAQERNGDTPLSSPDYDRQLIQHYLAALKDAGK